MKAVFLIWLFRIALTMEPDYCAICQRGFDDGDSAVSLTSCCHRYHQLCIDTWVATKNSCPLCRKPVVDGLEDEINSYVSEGEESDGWDYSDGGSQQNVQITNVLPVHTRERTADVTFTELNTEVLQKLLLEFTPELKSKWSENTIEKFIKDNYGFERDFDLARKNMVSKINRKIETDQRDQIYSTILQMTPEDKKYVEEVRDIDDKFFDTAKFSIFEILDAVKVCKRREKYEEYIRYIGMTDEDHYFRHDYINRNFRKFEEKSEKHVLTIPDFNGDELTLLEVNQQPAIKDSFDIWAMYVWSEQDAFFEKFVPLLAQFDDVFEPRGNFPGQHLTVSVEGINQLEYLPAVNNFSEIIIRLFRPFSANLVFLEFCLEDENGVFQLYKYDDTGIVNEIQIQIKKTDNNKFKVVANRFEISPCETPERFFRAQTILRNNGYFDYLRIEYHMYKKEN